MWWHIYKALSIYSRVDCQFNRINHTMYRSLARFSVISNQYYLRRILLCRFKSQHSNVDNST
jgi:hypothetical protein